MDWQTRMQPLESRFRPLLLPPNAGFGSHLGGWVFADSFDTILRQLSRAYLRAAWQQVAQSVAPIRALPPDLCWGALHSGGAFVAGGPANAPSDYLGLVSCELFEIDREPAWQESAQILGQTAPALQPGTCYRGLLSRIAPADADAALEFVAWVCLDEITNWLPATVARYHTAAAGPWAQVALALGGRDQAALDQALAAALASYTPVGYALVVGGMHMVQERWGRDHSLLSLPAWPDWWPL